MAVRSAAWNPGPMSRRPWYPPTVALGAALVLSGCTSTSAPAAPDAWELVTHSPALAEASADYTGYVRSEVEALVAATSLFAEEFTAADDDSARETYLEARTHLERIEPVVQSVGDVWVRLELREDDLGATELWTGWHHAESILWPRASSPAADADARSALAEQLVADTATLAQAVGAQDFAVAAQDIGAAAKELLDEVVVDKIAGTEEVYSDQDIAMLAANVEGARRAFEALAPAAQDQELVATIEERFAALDAVLAGVRSQGGYPRHDDLTPDQLRDLARAADALAEPLSRLTAAAVVTRPAQETMNS